MRRSVAILGVGVALLAVPSTAQAVPNPLAEAQAALKAALPLSTAAESIDGVTVRVTVRVTEGGNAGQFLDVQISADARIIGPGGSNVYAFSEDTMRTFVPAGFLVETTLHPDAQVVDPKKLSPTTRRLLHYYGIPAWKLITIGITDPFFVPLFRRILMSSYNPRILAGLIVNYAEEGRMVDADTVELTLSEDAYSDAILGPQQGGVIGDEPTEPEDDSIVFTFDIDASGRISGATTAEGSRSMRVAVLRYAAPKAVPPAAELRIDPRRLAKLDEATVAYSAGRSLLRQVKTVAGRQPTIAKLKLTDGLSVTDEGVVARSRYVNKSVLITSRGGGVTWTSRVTIRSGKTRATSWQLGTRSKPTRITAVANPVAVAAASTSAVATRGTLTDGMASGIELPLSPVSRSLLASIS